MASPLHIALIGHRFMGRAHNHALQQSALLSETGLCPVKRTLCGVEDDLAETAGQWGWERWTHDWHAAVADPEVDLVDIATPGNTHAEIAVAAARAGKHVLCEKPMALNAGDAAAMLEAASDAGVTHCVNFNYRRLPAVALAQQLIRAGEIGTIYYFRATYWQDWPLAPDSPWVWRMDRGVAGAGSMADKGSHLVDLARFLAGEFAEVAATSEIFVRERPSAAGPRPVTTDDAAAFLARFRNGAIGLFGTSRMSAGHKNSLGFEINGSKGSIVFDLERLNELQLYSASDPSVAQGFRTILATQPEHPYMKSWWPPGHAIGWEHTFVHQYYDIFTAIAGGGSMSPSFADGLRAQQVLDAVESAAREKRWVEVPT